MPNKEKGFSLIELIVVLIITAILSQIGFTAFNRYVRRTRAFAAKTALLNIKKECESNSDIKAAEEFTALAPAGYSLLSGNLGDCNGNNGLIVAKPNNPSRLPEYSYDFSNRSRVKCTKNSSDNFFKNCNSLKDKLEKNVFVMKDSYFTRECSDYVVVDGPKWGDAQANAIKLGGNLVTIDNEDESNWLMNTYRKIGENVDRDRYGARQLFIGLTRKYETGEKTTNLGGRQDGWISGSDSDWRPPYWGNQEGGEFDGDSSAIAYGQCGATENCWANWNDFPEYRNEGKGLVEIPKEGCKN